MTDTPTHDTSDNRYDHTKRHYSKGLRTTAAKDAELRAYAQEYEITPYEALEIAIDRLRDDAAQRAQIEALRGENALLIKAHNEAEKRANSGAPLRLARADLAAARAQIEDLTLERDNATDALRIVTERLTAEIEQLKSELAAAVSSRAALADDLASTLEREQRGAQQPCACALPDDFAPRVLGIRLRRSMTEADALAFVLKNGCDRIEASDRYQDAQKAAKRAAKEA